jgi:uncharacterized membrane protein
VSQQSLSPQAAKRAINVRVLAFQIAISVAVTALLTTLALKPGRLAAAGGFMAEAHLHWPRLSLLTEASPAIKIHVVAVVSALIVGGVLLSGVKGNRLHRTLGWGWVVAMAGAAVASLFIQQITRGHGFSWLHLFSGWTLIALPIAVVAARRHNVRMHSRTMTGLFVGGLIVAGITAFLPGRLMWDVFFG